MTDNELDKLDKLAGAHIMGFPNGFVSRFFERSDEHGPWQPTRNIAQAWKLLDKINDTEFELLRCFYTDASKTYWEAGFFNLDIYDRSETAPLAITKACLKAKQEK